jgi:putative endonuclease
MGLLQSIAALFVTLDRRPTPVLESHTDLGRYGEEVALALLRRRGYRLLLKNYKTRHEEIDLVCRDGKVLVFVEVKTRRGDRFGRPGEAVGPGKQRRLIRAAEGYLMAAGNPRVMVRFDVVEVEVTEGEIPRCHVIPNAYTA